MEFVPDVGHQAMLVDVRKLKQGANVVDIVDKALRMGEGHQLKKLENVAKAVNALEDEIPLCPTRNSKARPPSSSSDWTTVRTLTS